MKMWFLVLCCCAELRIRSCVGGASFLCTCTTVCCFRSTLMLPGPLRLFVFDEH